MPQKIILSDSEKILIEDFLDKKTSEEIIADSEHIKDSSNFTKNNPLNRNTIIRLIDHYNDKHKNNKAALEESLDKLAAFAAVTKSLQVPEKLKARVEVYKKGIKLSEVQKEIDNSEKLQKFTKAFESHVNTTTRKENKADDTNWENRRFDSLSRLITLNSQCAAVCYDGEQILVAFNELNHKGKNSGAQTIKATLDHTKEVFNYLKTYAEYTNLPPEKQDDFAEKHNLAGKREKLFLRDAQHYYENNSDQIDTFKYIYNANEEELKKIKDNPAIAAAFRAKQDLMKLEDALTPDTPEKRKFNAAIIKEFEKDPSYTLVYDGPLDNKGHAEMRIVDYLRRRQDPNNKLNKNVYIGLSKLCCTSCDIAINK